MPSSPERRILFSVLAAALVAAGAGCSPRSEVVARVGKSEITLAEFNAAVKAGRSRFPGPAEFAKPKLVDYLVTRELLALEAKRTPFTPDSVIERVRRDAEERVLSRSLIDHMMPRDPDPMVSEGELRRFYEWRKTATRCELIYAPDRHRADAALAELRRGADFGTVSDRYSLAGVLPPGGQVGLVVPGSVLEPLDRIIRETPVGSLIGPIESTREGWFVVHILERQPQKQPPYEDQVFQLRDMLRQRKRQLASLRAFSRLRRDYLVRTDPKGVEVFYRHYNTPPEIRSMGGESIPAEPTAEERRTVLARYDAGSGGRGEYTFAEALLDLERLDAERPTAGMMPSFQQWIEAQVVRRMTMVEARRRHLHEEPEIASAIEEQVKDQLIQGVYEAEVAAHAQPTDEDTRAAYAEHADAFREILGARVRTVSLTDSALAFTLAGGGVPLEEGLRAAGAHAAVAEESVRYPTTDSFWGGLRGTLQGAHEGQVIGPIPAGGSWRLVQLVAKEVRSVPLEELPPVLQQNLRTQGTRFAHERRLGELVERLKRDFPVTIDPRVLRKAPWPEPLPDMMGALPGMPSS